MKCTGQISDAALHETDHDQLPGASAREDDFKDKLQRRVAAALTGAKQRRQESNTLTFPDPA
eukprot:11905925-Heterocapsa_arctica.AAC.1